MLIQHTLIEDTYSEAFSTWVSLLIITAANKYLAHAAAVSATGFATSVIGCGAEAGIDHFLFPDRSPDGRPGYVILLAHPNKSRLKDQLIQRMAECVLPVPTTAVFNGLPSAPETLPVKLHYFGDGYEYATHEYDREVWKIPITGGEFIIEETIGCVHGVGGGNFLVMGPDPMETLTAAQSAGEIIHEIEGVATSFPSGVVGSGSKVGSRRYKFLPASTNELFCPTLRESLPASQIPPGVGCVYEVVINGINEEVVRTAMAGGIQVACRMPGVSHISAGNYGGTLGSYKFYLHEILSQIPRRNTMNHT